MSLESLGIKDMMNGNFWIIIGIIASAIAAFSLPYGFYLKDKEKKAESYDHVQGDVVMGNKTVNNYVAVITDREIREKFPAELTFYGSDEVDFNSSKRMFFESSQAQARIEIAIGKIYLKGDKFYIIFSVNLFDKKNNTDWIDLHAETEVSRGKIAVARTDRFALYLHIIETELTKAKVSIGIEMVSRDHIFKNFVIKGNAINFE